MNKMRNLIFALLGLLALAVLVAGLAWLLGPQGALPGPQVSPVQTPVLTPIPLTTLPTETPSALTTSPIQTPTPSQFPMHLPTATPSLADSVRLAAGRVVHGYGNFPRLPVVMPGADGTTLVLYIVEGDQAVQLLSFEGSHIGADPILINRLSPDGNYVAYLMYDTWNGLSALAVVDVQGTQNIILDRGAGDIVPEKGAAHEDITGLAWLDNEHIVYSRVTMPSTEEFYANWESGTPLPVRGEIWLTDLEGEKQLLLASAPVERLLGASPDGARTYSTCYPDPEHERFRGQGFCVLDRASGTMRMLWPSADHPPEGSSTFNDLFAGCELVTMPDYTLQVVLATTEGHDGPPSNPADVWLGDPESGEVELVWTTGELATDSAGMQLYDVPGVFFWSPYSTDEFVYLAGGWSAWGIWWVNTETGQSRKLMDNGYPIAWTPEGIVVRGWTQEWTFWDILSLLDENGQVQGEIRFSADVSLAP